MSGRIAHKNSLRSKKKKKKIAVLLICPSNDAYVNELDQHRFQVAKHGSGFHVKTQLLLKIPAKRHLGLKRLFIGRDVTSVSGYPFFPRLSAAGSLGKELPGSARIYLPAHSENAFSFGFSFRS